MYIDRETGEIYTQSEVDGMSESAQQDMVDDDGNPYLGTEYTIYPFPGD